MAKRVPKGFNEPGKALWRSIWAELDRDGLELDAREHELLYYACRTADELALLEAAVDKQGAVTTGSNDQPVVHPGIREARQLRLLLSQLLGRIDLGAAGTVNTQRARTAANARWSEAA